MDPEIANVLQAACYSAAAFGGVYAIARYGFLKRKSSNETYSNRIDADMRLDQQRLETAEKRLQLMNSPEFKDYQERRTNLANELIEQNPDLNKWPHNDGELDRTLDMVVGRSPLD